MSMINIRGFQKGAGANFQQFVSERLNTILDYDHEKAGSGLLKFWDDAKNYMNISGSNLKYKMVKGEVFGITSGTIDGFKAVSEGIAVISAEKLGLNGKAISKAIDSGSTTKFLNTFLSGNDTIKATNFDDTFWGGDGHDTLFGYRGADRISGGSGNDTLTGGTGNDTLKGDAGNDKLKGQSGEQLKKFFPIVDKNKDDAIDPTELAEAQKLMPRRSRPQPAPTAGGTPAAPAAGATGGR